MLPETRMISGTSLLLATNTKESIAVSVGFPVPSVKFPAEFIPRVVTLLKPKS